MKYEYAPKMPVTQTEEKVIINGQEIGWMRDCSGAEHGSRFHAGINLDVQGLMFTELIQGFGDTKEDAINQALTKGRAKADAIIAAIDALWGDNCDEVA